MSLSDCAKCWSTPCECGHNYKHWSAAQIEKQITMLKAVLADKLLEERRIEASWSGPGGR